MTECSKPSSLLQFHQVHNGGYGDPRENESWCDCGWEYEHEDMMGQAALSHSLKENRPYWAALEELLAADRELDEARISHQMYLNTIDPISNSPALHQADLKVQATEDRRADIIVRFK